MMMGVFFSYHVMSTIPETGSHQTDITPNGVFYSYMIFIPLYVIFNGIILAHLYTGFGGIVNFIYIGNMNNFNLVLNLI